MTANKKLFCDCNSSLRNGCDYDEAVAVMVGKKYFINDKFSANTKDMTMTFEVMFITMLFSLAYMALDSASVNPDDWAGDDESLAIVLREEDAYDQIGRTYRMVVDAMCPRTWRILATATICDDIRCTVVESNGKKCVCETVFRDDLPHGEEA